MTRLFAALALTLGLAAGVSAGPLNQQQVAADAKWLVHLDFDAVRDTKLADRIQEVWLQDDTVKQGLNLIRVLIGADLTQDLHGVTFHGDRFVEGDGVAIVHLDLDEDRIVSQLSLRSKHQSEVYGDNQLHTWTSPPRAKEFRRISGCFYRPSLVVFGQELDDVKAALDVLDGKLPSLAGSDSPLAADLPDGTMFAAGATGLDSADVPVLSPIVRQSGLLWLIAGEHEGEAFAQAGLVTNSSEVASLIRQIVEGFIALAILQHGSDEDVKGMLQAIELATDAGTVTVELRGDGDNVMKLIERELIRAARQKQKD